jgi:hypothetical protein
MNDNIIDRDVVQDAYIRDLMYSMDKKERDEIIYDSIDNDLDQLSITELIDELEKYKPSLLNTPSTDKE